MDSDSDSMHSAVTRDDTTPLTESEWLSMQKRIARLVGKASASNVALVADQILAENIVAARGFFCQTLIKLQSESPDSTDVHAALAAIINSRFPQVGHLLVKRAVLQFKAAHGRRDRDRMQTASAFLAQLVNQRVVYEHLALNVLMLLLSSDDDVEVAASFCAQCGALLLDVVRDKLKEILAES
ncbi:uncharacterized protein LOC131021121 [Salvia miltiorrhiza]|uniref:uncharacterized protein LOC131021121 n=1 Tax=Salvia miltiorrhiza TaxID=226208 RepID=UPI0025ACD864|nr:uncharacterized protein LOC131021121 [Salvia miltiorrhiza]